MTQDQRLEYLIHYLLAEREEYRDVALPASPAEKRRLLRALVNVRPPEPLDQTFYQVQDAYLQEELRRKGVTRLSDLEPVRPGLYLWQGDITTLAVDAIVNAANSAMLGWGGHEHPRHHQVQFLAAGLAGPPGLLRLRQSGRGVLSARACGALGLHQRGHRGRFGTVINTKTAGGWEPCRRFCCVMRLFWHLPRGRGPGQGAARGRCGPPAPRSCAGGRGEKRRADR